MSNIERRSISIAKKLVKALVAVEQFPFDPEMIFSDSKILMRGPLAMGLAPSQIDEVKSALNKLQAEFCGGAV